MKNYPPGYFTDLIRRHDFPPRFRAQPTPKKPPQQNGRGGWGDGTMNMPGTPKHAAPGSMNVRNVK